MSSILNGSKQKSLKGDCFYIMSLLHIIANISFYHICSSSSSSFEFPHSLKLFSTHLFYPVFTLEMFKLEIQPTSINVL